MPSEVVSPGTRMLRFLTPTEEWAGRIGNPVSVPAQWPFMLAEIFVADDDVIWMTSAVGARWRTQAHLSFPIRQTYSEADCLPVAPTRSRRVVSGSNSSPRLR